MVNDYKERVVTEKANLDAQLGRLAAFFTTETFKGIDTAEQGRLVRQCEYMTNYSLVLGERIAAWQPQ